MKNKTYLLTLILFLLFFNGSILMISIVNLKTSLDSTRENCLREHSFITIALTKDLTALESRGTEAGSALQVLFDSYVHYYGKQNVYLELSQKGQTLYSSLLSDIIKPVASSLSSSEMEAFCIYSAYP